VAGGGGVGVGNDAEGGCEILPHGELSMLACFQQFV
jgi:hypothetical protein